MIIKLKFTAAIKFAENLSHFTIPLLYFMPDVAFKFKFSCTNYFISATNILFLLCSNFVHTHDNPF